MSKRYSDQRVPGTKSPDGAGRDSLLRIDLNTYRFVPFLLCALAISVRAELPSARLLTVSPAGGQAGSAVEVTVSGKDLDDLAGLHISSPGLSATLKSGSVFTVRIGMDTPPGVYDLRAVGKYGASNPRAFSVGLAREIGAMEENNSPARAQLVPLGTTVNGRSKADAGQYFRVAARKGDYIVARCEAAAIDSRFEPVLELTDASGRELASSLNRGSIGFLVRQNGELVVGLHDVIYRGGAEYFYRLSIGNFPSIDSITPLALVGTNTARFEVVGHNLPGGKKTGESADDADGRRWDKGHKVKGGEKAGAARDPSLERIEIELSPNDPRVRRALTRLPAEAGEDIFECRLQSERGVSEPALFTFPSGALQTEGSAQHAPDSGRVVSLPWEANGVFAMNREPASLSFRAAKGEVYWMEILSQRLGFSSDPLLIVQRLATNHPPSDVLELNDSDENLGGPGFNTKSRDPRGRFEAKEDGLYRVQIRDTFTHVRGSTPSGYRLMIRKPTPDFRLVAMPLAPPPAQKDGKQLPVSTVTVWRGGVEPIRVVAFRRDGFDGEIQLSLENLPDGVTAPPAKLEASRTACLVFLTASEGTASSVSDVTIRGTAEIKGVRVSHPARAVTALWAVNDFDTEPVTSRACEEFVMSILGEEQPIRVRPAETNVWLGVAGEKVRIPLVVAREAEVATENFNVTPTGVSELEKMKEFQIEAKATNVVYEIDLKQTKLAPGDYTFSLQGQAKGHREKPKRFDIDFTLYSAPITLRVSAASTNAPTK